MMTTTGQQAGEGTTSRQEAGTAEGMAAGVEQTTGVGQKADTDRVKGGESKAAVNDSGGLTQEADVDGGGWEGEMEVSNTVNCSLVHNQPNDDEGEEKSAEMQGDDVNGVLDEEGRGGARVATDNEGCCEHEDAAVNDDSAEADRAKVWMRQAEELFSWIAETERTEIQSSPGLAGKLASIGTKLSVAQQLISTAPTKTVLDERPHRASCFPSRPKFQVVASAPNVVENLQRSASELMEAGQRCLTSLRPYLEVFEGVMFNWRRAGLLAILSDLVYHEVDGTIPDDRVEDALGTTPIQTTPIQNYFRNEKTNNAFLGIATDTDIYLVFRGTKTTSWKNWKQNFDIRSAGINISSSSSSNEREDDATRVHSGFYKAQQSVWQEVMQFVKEHTQESGGREGFTRKNLWLTGHSLGGAMALITAVLLAEELSVPCIDGVYTFGSPCLFNEAAAKQYDQHPVLRGRTFRVKAMRDKVPSLLSLRYSNPGLSTRISELDTLRAHEEAGNGRGRSMKYSRYLRLTRRWTKVVGGPLGPFTDLPGMGVFIDGHDALHGHHMVNYVGAVQNRSLRSAGGLQALNLRSGRSVAF